MPRVPAYEWTEYTATGDLAEDLRALAELEADGWQPAREQDVYPGGAAVATSVGRRGVAGEQVVHLLRREVRPSS